MYEEADCDEVACDNPPWQWCWSGDHLDTCGCCCDVVGVLQFEGEDVPPAETEDVERLEQEGLR